MAYATRPLTLPQTATKPIFNFYQGGLSGQGGEVEILDVMGLVINTCGTQTGNLVKVSGLVTGPTQLTPVDLCAGVDMTAAAIGTIFNITGTLASAATLNVNGVAVAQATPIHIGFGANAQLTITAALSEGGGGLVQWHLIARASYGVVIVPAVQ